LNSWTEKAWRRSYLEWENRCLSCCGAV